jgi:hypothetical protein
MSATTTGGNFRCSHGLDTDDVNEWNEHCSDSENGHFDSGTTTCIGCGEALVFENIPYHKIDQSGSKNIQLRCEECEDAIKESYKSGLVRKASNTA